MSLSNEASNRAATITSNVVHDDVRSGANVVVVPPLEFQVLLASVHSSFRLITRSSSSSFAHDGIDLVTLVRRSWYGELKRTRSGVPRSVRYRFPLLACTASTAADASSESPEQQQRCEVREHKTVSAVVERSGHVSLHTAGDVEDIAPLAMYIHQQLRPYVCAPGAGAELEYSIATSAPEELRLVHFGAVILLPPVLFATSHYGGPRRSKGRSLPIRHLRDRCVRWMEFSSATTASNINAPTGAVDRIPESDQVGTENPQRRSPKTHHHHKRVRVDAAGPSRIHIDEDITQTTDDVGDDDDEEDVSSLFQLQSAFMFSAAADVFHIASSPRVAQPAPDDVDRGRVGHPARQPQPAAATELPCGTSSDHSLHQGLRDSAPPAPPSVRNYQSICRAVVLPSREEQNELRVAFLPVTPLHEEHARWRSSDGVRRRSHHTVDEVILSFMHTGTVRVVRAASYPLLQWTVEYVLAPFLADVLLIGGAA